MADDPIPEPTASLEAAVTDALLDLRQQIGETPDGESSVDAEVGRIAQRLRRARDAEDLTLHELARRSGVAASTIQKVETQQMVPTVAVLLKIAHGLGRDLGELVRSGGDDARIAHLTADQRHPVHVRSGLVAERLVGDLFEPVLEAWRITHAPGSDSGRGRISYDGESLIICEAGTIRCQVGDAIYELHVGDTLHFKRTIPHEWRNCGDEPARLLIVGTLPRELRASLHERLRGPRAAGLAAETT